MCLHSLYAGTHGSSCACELDLASPILPRLSICLVIYFVGEEVVMFVMFLVALGGSGVMIFTAGIVIFEGNSCTN